MNKPRLGLALGAGMVAALAGGLLVASNMGFKGSYPLNAQEDGVSLSGSNTLGLPYQQPDVGTAKDLMDDIGFAEVDEVSRFVESADSFETYTGRKGTPSPDFSVVPGQGLFVKVNTTGDYVIVGSHDPFLTVDLEGPGGSSLTGTNFFSPPYHHIALTAKELMDDMGFEDVAEVSRYLRATDALETYTGRKGTPNPDFTLKPGEAYFVKMLNTVGYSPSHY